MDETTVLAAMRKYFGEKLAPDVAAGFAEEKPSAHLKESLDVVDFIVFLEEELGKELDPSRIGPAMTNMTFAELAAVVSRELSEE